MTGCTCVAELAAGQVLLTDAGYPLGAGLGYDSILHSQLSIFTRESASLSPDQPLPEAIAVEKESVLRDSGKFSRTGSSKPFSRALTAFLVKVFAEGKKVVRR